MGQEVYGQSENKPWNLEKDWAVKGNMNSENFTKKKKEQNEHMLICTFSV